MTETDNDDVRGGKTLRFDGTVTAGNLLTASAFAVALAVWGIRLEGKVDHGDDLRARLELAVAQRSQEQKESTDRSIAIVRDVIAENASRTRDSDNEMKSALRRIEAKFDALIMPQPAPQNLRQAR
jgi:acyl dehydratase